MARDFDTTIVYGKETTVDQIVEAAKRFPHDGKPSINCGKGSAVLGPQH